MRPLGERTTVNFAFHKLKASRYSADANRAIYESDRKDDHRKKKLIVNECRGGY